MHDEIHSIIRRYTWEIASKKSVADHNVLPGTWSFKINMKHDWTISKFKAQYCVRENVQKRLSPELLNLYYPVVQWAKVILIMIF